MCASCQPCARTQSAQNNELSRGTRTAKDKTTGSPRPATAMSPSPPADTGASPLPSRTLGLEEMSRSQGRSWAGRGLLAGTGQGCLVWLTPAKWKRQGCNYQLLERKKRLRFRKNLTTNESTRGNPAQPWHQRSGARWGHWTRAAGRARVAGAWRAPLCCSRNTDQQESRPASALDVQLSPCQGIALAATT